MRENGMKAQEAGYGAVAARRFTPYSGINTPDDHPLQ